LLQTAPYIRIQDTDSSTGVTAQGGFEMYDSDGDRLFYLANESSSSSDVSLFNNAGGALKFGTSGSERGQFDSSGRLLVGTSSALTGSNSQYSKVVALGNSANNAGGYFSIAAGSARGNDEDVANLWFTDNGAGEYASIRVFADGATGSGDYPGRLVFSTTADGAATPTERLRITSAGLVGIGTASPSQLLHLQGSDIGIFVKNTNSSGTSRLLFGNDLVSEAQIFYNGSTKSSFGGNGALTIYHGGNKPILFATANTERIRIDGSGRLLVGTSTNSNVSTACFATRSDGAASAWVYLQTTETTPANGNTIGSLVFNSTGNTSVNSSAYIICQRDGGTWTNTTSMPGRLSFSTTADGAASPTERMRITNSGAILLGCTAAPNPGAASTSNGWAINGTGATAYVTSKIDNGPCGYFRRDGTDGGVFLFYKGSSPVGSISVTAAATAYNTSSDYRLKENVTAVTDGITRLQQLKPSRFNFIADPDKTVDGFLAHEVQTIVPEAITGDKG
jgi:hypothetical protein